MPLGSLQASKVTRAAVAACVAVLLVSGTAAQAAEAPAPEVADLLGDCDRDGACAVVEGAPYFGDDGSVNLLQRRGAYVLGHPAGEAAVVPEVGRASPLHPLRRWDVLGAVLRLARGERQGLAAGARAYASLPAVVAYGLPLILGPGLLQVTVVVAFWAVVRPAAAAVEAVLPGLDGQGRPVDASHLDGLAMAYATAAHFYWAWGLLELASRRRPLRRRLAAVALLAALLLPVPLVQVWLGDRSTMQASIGALVGSTLGLPFFFVLRLPLAPLAPRPAEVLLPEHKTAKSATNFLVRWATPRDNLSDFWGGSIWHPSVQRVWLPEGCCPGAGCSKPRPAG